jgi:hypothetical protein
MKTKPVESKRSIEEHWRLGKELSENWRGRVYGKAVAVNMAKKGEGGMGSAESVHFHHRLAERCSPELVRSADEAGISWNRFIALLSYMPSPNERKNSVCNASRKEAVALREAQVGKFIEEHKQGKLRGVQFTNAVMDWRAQHIGLWSAGKQRRRKLDREMRVKRDLSTVREQFQANEKLLLAGRGREAREQWAIVRRALDKADRALNELLSPKTNSGLQTS